MCNLPPFLLFVCNNVALSERGGYITAAREGEVPGMGLVVLVSPDLEECSILRQWVCEFSSRGSIHNFNKLKKLPRNIVNESIIFKSNAQTQILFGTRVKDTLLICWGAAANDLFFHAVVQ